MMKMVCGFVDRLLVLLDGKTLLAAGWCFLVVFAMFSAARLALTFRMETTGWGSDPLGVCFTLVLGAINDAGAALILSAMAYLFIAVCARRGCRWFAQMALACATLAVVFGAVAEIFFWEEFASRFNGIAVFYLIFPREIIGNLRESFDLELLLPPIVAVALVIWWRLRPRFHSALNRPRRRFHLLRGVTCAAITAALGMAFSCAVPASVFSNRELNEITLNGLANMTKAALTNDSHYDGVYPGIDESQALPLLRDVVAQDNTRFLDSADQRSIRRHVDNGTRPKRLNIVLVIEESFGSNYVDALDSSFPKPVTPQLTRLAKDGLFFTNMYASGQRSVRGLEAILTSFTPIPGISTVRRPGSKGMHSLPHVLGELGYQSAMMYGGRAVFDNMGPFWWGIGFDHVWDQNNISHQSFTTAWGVSDEDLFAEALDRMDERGSGEQPFLLTLFTVSNHRPYTFPQDRIKWDPELGNRGNTARYADFAFGDFIDKARSHTWFDDTVFVFIADHGHKVNGAAQVPLHRYRIPLLVYSPKHVQPGVVTTLAAQVDFIPTLLGLLDFSYESHFFGIDLMRVPSDEGRIVVAHNFSVAFARPGHAVVLNPDGTQRGYRFIPGVEKLDSEELSVAVSAEARALTQTAHRMFYNGQYHVTASPQLLRSSANEMHVGAGQTATDSSPSMRGGSNQPLISAAANH